MFIDMVYKWERAAILVAISCVATLPVWASAENFTGDEFHCSDGSWVKEDQVCDGTLDCADDEALELCRGTRRPLFGLILYCLQPWSSQHDLICPEVCLDWPQYCYYAIIAEHGAPGTCVLPQPSKRGAYFITDVEPRGQGPAGFSLVFPCPYGYRLQGQQPRCKAGNWTADFPTCVSAMAPDGPPVSTVQPTVNTTTQCVLPEFPEHGSYVVQGDPEARPGQVLGSAILIVHCQSGYMTGKSRAYCISGDWSSDLPKCIRFCKLPPSSSVTYMCSEPGLEGTRQCQNSAVPDGTVVIPQCRSTYYATAVLNKMYCLDGTWDYIATCRAECGVLSPSNNRIIGGPSSIHPEIPWHVVMYDKNTVTYRQLCGGSLLTSRVVISAAHCYTNEEGVLREVHYFAAAVGTVYRGWNISQSRDQGSIQTSDVREINIPEAYRGVKAFYQNDISMVTLEKVVVFNTFVRPVCLDTSFEMNRNQLREGNLGKIVSWGPLKAGARSQMLQVKELPYVEFGECLMRSVAGYKPFIGLVDKFCAGHFDGAGLCQGDSGSGLVFPANERGVQRYYIGGVASIGMQPDVGKTCSPNGATGFTSVHYHERFIKRHVTDPY